jgi:hypothetical protein
MPSTPSRTVSSRLVRAAAAERMALLRERAKLVRRRESAAAQLAALEEQLATVDDRLGLIDRLAPEAANVHPLPSRDSGEGLKGASIRQAAIDVLLRRPHGAGPIHYKEWFALLEQAGKPVAGKDPLAVFLTQISRSPVVRRTTQSGVYELDVEVPERLRTRLARLHARLAACPPALGDSEERAERDRIVAEISAAERALDEAERALAQAAGGRGTRAAGSF